MPRLEHKPCLTIPHKELDLIEEAILTDRQVAKIIFKDAMKPTSWKTIQALARNNRIRGQRIGRVWRFHKDAVRDFLMMKGGR